MFETFSWSSLVWALVLLAPLWGALYALFFLVTLPMRRAERARFFLDLVETGLRDGHAIEHTITSVARCGDESLGGRFHLLAAYVEDGRRFPEALAKVPRLLPASVEAMLRAGAEIGDLSRVLPACRGLLRDGLSQTRGALNYLIILVFVVLPVVPFVFIVVAIFVEPKLQQLFADFSEDLPHGPLPFFGLGMTLAAIQLTFSLLFAAAVAVFIGGPRLFSWFEAGWFFPIGDWLFWLVPWRRKRMQRDFSAMLGLLLDAGVPEARAVTLAAESTANRVFLRRARRVAERLAQGVKLPEALSALDASGEFAWRLRNACQPGEKFFGALTGWLESLDAKAFQQEQAAAHGFSTLLIALNGVMVGIFAFGLFQMLTSILDAGILW